ncbi:MULTISPECIES: GntR family transcriptional regulator [Nonomuraea]|jgi:DNA-binding GntR family transcriptional regulator|uniref:GntR family transcriptional regulator n=2 Tax=Nonomuraea TaxID=83681 RepID=A0ABW1BRU4_9ACTN|nr:MULTISPECIES: GntR family transcriptional regulator [Nonomuraea]MDA0640655.1 GntR family transcriptional regulator [Nonomuraea ferruginea]TXK41373.1 GntR family transcriptional regulator [Nonomuraea sp. C10]
MSFAVPLTRKEAVLRQLRDEIITGRLKPGAAIKDAEIAARLGVSITPVREAVTQLAAEGLIDISPNRTRQVTQVTQKSALELIDVMMVLACAGFEWGVDNLTDEHLAALRGKLDDFAEGLRHGNATVAAAAGADFSTVVILASGNRELQTHVDLVVTRTLRVLALTAESEVWNVWLDGYREVLELLERGDRSGAAGRYRQIYRDYRRRVEAMLFDEDH